MNNILLKILSSYLKIIMIYANSDITVQVVQYIVKRYIICIEYIIFGAISRSLGINFHSSCVNLHFSKKIWDLAPCIQLQKLITYSNLASDRLICIYNLIALLRECEQYIIKLCIFLLFGRFKGKRFNSRFRASYNNTAPIII